MLTGSHSADVPCSTAAVLVLYLILTFAYHLPVCVSAALAVRRSSNPRRFALRRWERSTSCCMFCVRCVRFISRIESGCPDWLGLRLLGPLLLPPMLKGDGNQAPLGLCLSHEAYTCFLFFWFLFIRLLLFVRSLFVYLDGVNEQNGRVCTYWDLCCCRPC